MMATRDMKSIARLGGLSLVSKPAPDSPCTCCGRTFKSWLSYIGHKGMLSTAARYFGGDTSACGRQLAYNALAREEAGKSWSNGAWSRKYRPITAGPRFAELAEDLHHAKIMANHGANEAVRAAARAVAEQIETELNTLKEQ